jgi:hypothetical protein
MSWDDAVVTTRNHAWYGILKAFRCFATLLEMAFC